MLVGSRRFTGQNPLRGKIIRTPNLPLLGLDNSEKSGISENLLDLRQKPPPQVVKRARSGPLLAFVKDKSIAVLINEGERGTVVG